MVQQRNKSIQPCCGRKLCQPALTDKWKSGSCLKHWNEFYSFLAFNKLYECVCGNTPVCICTDHCTIKGIHTGADMQNKAYTNRTLWTHLHSDQNVYFFNLKLRWWLLIPAYCARSESFCLRLIWCFVAIWCVSAWMCFLMCECAVMCLGYQVWNGRQSPVLACRHTQRGALMAQEPAHSFSLPFFIFFFTFFCCQTQ